MRTDDAQSTFIIIPEHVMQHPEIDWPHRAIWGIVYAFSHNGGECWLSVESIAKRIHRKRRQTSTMIQKLIDVGLLECVSWNGRKRSLRTTKFVVNSNVQSIAYVQPAAHQPCNIPHISHAENRTSAMRNSAHIENNLEDNLEKNKSTDKNELVVVESTNLPSPPKRKNSSSGSQPNSIDECREYFAELGSNDADAFWDYWSSVGWKRRTGKIVCWKSTARNWVRREKQNTNGKIDKNKPFDINNAIDWAAK